MPGALWQFGEAYDPLLKLMVFQTSITEGNAEFQLEVSQNKDVVFFPIQLHRPLNSIQRILRVHGPHIMNPWL